MTKPPVALKAMKPPKLTPFEEAWGFQRTGDWSGWMTLLCTRCNVPIGKFTRYDWMTSRLSPPYIFSGETIVRPSGRIEQLLSRHLEQPETAYQCLVLHFTQGEAFYEAIARNPSADPVWLRAISQCYGSRYHEALAKNPVLQMLLVEDPAHQDWISPVLASAQRSQARKEEDKKILADELARAENLRLVAYFLDREAQKKKASNP